MRCSHLKIVPAVFAAVLCLSSCCLSSCAGSKETSVKVYPLGSRVESGHIIYTVFETQWLPQLGAGDTARVPKNRYFLVRLSAVNSGGEEVLVPNMTLLDDQGNAVEELSNGEGVPQWINYIRKVRPADSIAGNVVFDAEPKHYQMRVTDENGENPALVDIPLTFNAETPHVLAAPVGSGMEMKSNGKK